MNTQALMDTAETLVANDKGLLAMDESMPTCNNRFSRNSTRSLASLDIFLNAY